jgi:hypothetical protein
MSNKKISPFTYLVFSLKIPYMSVTCIIFLSTEPILALPKRPCAITLAATFSNSNLTKDFGL